MQKQACLFCGNMVELVHVHGHYQCPVCKTNALPCCDGDNCETNTLLRPITENSLNTKEHNDKPETISAKHS